MPPPHKPNFCLMAQSLPPLTEGKFIILDVDGLYEADDIGGSFSYRILKDVNNMIYKLMKFEYLQILFISGQ